MVVCVRDEDLVVLGDGEPARRVQLADRVTRGAWNGVEVEKGRVASTIMASFRLPRLDAWKGGGEGGCYE